MTDGGANTRLVEGPGGTRFGPVRWLDRTDSTNRVAADLVRDGAAEGVVVVADEQTAGRGRLGRTWVAPPGAGLLTSIVLRPALAPERRHLTSLAVALAAVDAVAETSGEQVVLKWPNDLLLGGRKLGGILAESVEEAVVVGIGINVSWPAALPDEIAATATALNHVTDAVPDRAVLLDALLTALERWYGPMGGDRGVALLDAYRQRCATLGQRVRVELADGSIEGDATAVDDDGALVVATAEGERRVTVGDVVHLRPA